MIGLMVDRLRGFGEGLTDTQTFAILESLLRLKKEIIQKVTTLLLSSVCRCDICFYF